MLNPERNDALTLRWTLGRDPLMSHSALSHDRAAWKAAHIVGEQQLAFYQGSNKTVIHHGLYLLNNAICLCVYPYSGSNVYLENPTRVGRMQLMQGG